MINHFFQTTYVKRHSLLKVKYYYNSFHFTPYPQKLLCNFLQWSVVKIVREWYLLAGLKNILIDCAGGNCCTTSTCGGNEASINIFLASGEK